MTLHSLSDSSSSFEWEEYLSKTSGRPADPKCFKQASTPPPNLFEINSLLEAEDQRSAAALDFQSPPVPIGDNGKSRAPGLVANATANGRRSTLLSSPANNVRRFRAASFTLAQVIEVCGSRIRIRLVGTDDRNDCWFLVDSDQIRPYPSGEPLQPPFGYMHNHLHWSRTLKTATEGAKLADPSWFVTPPSGPADNYFKLGDKLEAVDRRNTQLICPATVGAVNGQHILINFDGWSDFDYWTRFDSRELFPVGWCKNSGYPLQPPGPSALRSTPTVHSTPMVFSTPQNKSSPQPTLMLSGRFSRSPALRTPFGRPRKGINAPAKQGHPKKPKERRVARVLPSKRKPVVSKTEVFSGGDVWERLSRTLTIAPPASPSDYNRSTASSVRSLSSPPVIHPVNEASSLNSSNVSSDHPPPTIEAAVPIPAELPSVRRTSSSSDCVVRLQLKSSPSSANASDAERKSWEVVRVRSPREKKAKAIKRHRHSLGAAHGRLGKRHKRSDNLRDSLLVSQTKSELSTSSAPATTGGRASPPAKVACAKEPVCPTKRMEPLSVPNNRSSSHADSSSLSVAPLNRSESQSVPHYPLHLYCDEFRGSSLSFTGHKSLPYPSACLDSVDPTDEEFTISAARIPTSQCAARYWCPHLKTEAPGSKLLDTCSTSHISEDYMDGQSLAPQVSSSTVSPSSLDLGPGPLPNPSFWTIDEVCHYVTTRDSTLSEVAEKFKHHEIDGQALLLLNMESLRNYMKIKLGPALKVDHLISRLKRGIL